jgi:ribosomal-protein-alanine N-acetyltransferase
MICQGWHRISLCVIMFRRMVSFSLRPATTDDLPKILETEKKVHLAPWGEENFKFELSKPYSHFLVLTDDETDEIIAGYIIYWVLFDECQILNVVVESEFRGLGYAKKMIRQAAQTALQKGIKKVSLEVRKSNSPAIQLYQNLNFTITHVRKGFYSNGEDAYQMTHLLEESLSGF